MLNTNGKVVSSLPFPPPEVLWPVRTEREHLITLMIGAATHNLPRAIHQGPVNVVRIETYNDGETAHLAAKAAPIHHLSASLHTQSVNHYGRGWESLARLTQPLSESPGPHS